MLTLRKIGHKNIIAVNDTAENKMKYSIYPPEGIMEAQVILPESKSIVSRRMVISALAEKKYPVQEDYCDDLKIMSAALATNGEEATLDLHKSATALRFLTAYFAVKEGAEVTLDGDMSLRKRPVGTLVDCLKQLGADIEYKGREGFCPLLIKGHRLEGGELVMDPGISSQWVSALMMAAPLMSKGLHLKFSAEPRSFPYIQLTAHTMAEAGIETTLNRYNIEIPAWKYEEPASWSEPAEGDWSAAAFWFETIALSAAWATLKGLKEGSVQADARAMELFGRLGVSSEFTDEGLELSANPEMYSRIDFDASDCPDLVPSVVVTCCALGVPFRITGIEALRVKESDRIEALTEETIKIGCVIDTSSPKAIEWEGRRNPIFEMPRINPHGDHRIAMAFAPVAVFVPGIVIENAECVAKSWPGYWDSLIEAGFTVKDLEAAENQSDEVSGEETEE